ncbi:MAG: DUF2244 domain-containing protein [Pseudomonadales bacterium]
MITSEFDQAGPTGRIVLRPNQSWTWRANAYLVGTLTVISGSVGVVFAFQGMWLILPFTLVEMAVLVGCLYYCVRRTHLQEVLTFSPDYLEYERGVKRPEIQRRFQRYFTRFFVRVPRHPWYCKRVCVCCREVELEIGSFLNSEEKEALVVALRSMISRLDHGKAS